MNAITYAQIRQRDLLAEADQAHLARLVELARRNTERCRPDFSRRLRAVAHGRRAVPVAC